MAFNSRAFHLLAVILFALAVAFAFDSLRQSLWANLALGALAAGALLILVGATRSSAAFASEPSPTRPDSAADLRVLLDQIPIPLIRHVDGTAPQAINKAARALFQTDDAILRHTDALAATISGPATAARPTLRVFDRQYAVSVSEIVSDTGYARLATLTDVQMEMHKAEAAALRDTLHILSHEIMNSLTPVASLADIARSYIAEDGETDITSAREALETLSRRTASLTRFIEAYRSVARLPEPSLEPVEPARLASDVVELFSRSPATSDVAFSLDAEDRLPRLSLDDSQISQALINVVTNAVEATEGLARPREVRLAVRRSHQNVIITVSDNGDGVPDNVRPNLFTAFATTKPKGTGTGLNLARQIALAHGGNLELLSGEGPTTFAFSFPLSPALPVEKAIP